MSTEEEPPKSPEELRVAADRRARLVGSLSLAGVVVLLVAVLGRNPPNPNPPGDLRAHFDNETTDNAELRRVTEAVSRILAAPPGRAHEEAVQGLEALRVESAGARDLKEACVNTYRGMLDVEGWMTELRSILLLQDGGSRPESQQAPGALLRAGELDRQTRERLRVVEESRDRCLDLYLAAAQRLGLVPEARARRPASATGGSGGGAR